MKKIILALALVGAASAATAQEDPTTLPARDVPLPVGICAGGLGAAGAALGLSLSNPATAASAIVALILCSIVVESELPS